MGKGGAPERAMLRKGGWPRAAGRVAGLLAVTAVAWLLVGVTSALGTWLWWLVASAPIVVFIMLPFALYWVSEGRVWPTWVAFAFMFALMLTAFAVPGDWYMRAEGVPVTATVGDSYCTENDNGRCLYNYILYAPDGAELPGEFRDTVRYWPDDTLDVVTDPRGIFGPRLADDLTTRFFDRAAIVSFAGFAATVVAAAVLGERRRRRITTGADASQPDASQPDASQPGTEGPESGNGTGNRTGRDRVRRTRHPRRRPKRPRR